MDLSYELTKSKIITGLRCPKKLWFDINEKIQVDHFNLHRGNVFGEKIKELYGDGFDLSNNFDEDIIQLTENAINDPKVNIIYEGAFLFEETLVRTDVLIRKPNGWKLIEAKCSASVKESHKQDIAIQYFVLKNSNIKITEAVITHLNKEFYYKGNNDYTELKIEVDVLNDIQEYVHLVPNWINDLTPITYKNSTKPSIKMGDHCENCQYINICESETFPVNIDTPISILPFKKGKDLKKEWFEKGIYDLKDLPDKVVQPLNDKRASYIEILKCHKQEVEWINPKFFEIINSFSWPRSFFDIESIKQAVPVIPDTKPDDQFPFQYSVHKWENKNQKLLIEDSLSFLEFNEDDMDRRFLISLIKNLGEDGPIFAYRRVEKRAIKYLSNRKNCLDLKPAIENITNRIVDTEQLLRENFYNPKMMGSYSLKNIVKALPKASLYSSENNEVGSGGDAMIKWFEYTNPNTSNEQRQKINDNLITYCAKDTLNLYHIFQYIVSKENPNGRL